MKVRQDGTEGVELEDGFGEGEAEVVGVELVVQLLGHLAQLQVLRREHLVDRQLGVERVLHDRFS